MISLTILLIGAACGRSEAQGYGGFGFGFQNNAYQDTQFLNSWSLQNAASAAANRPKPLTAPSFQSRDESFLDRYDLATRESMINRIARNPGREMSTVNPTGARLPGSTASTPRAPRTPQPVAAPEPPSVVLLGNFFDRERRLVWPTVAPITGDMGKKQEIADQAVLAVLNEYDLQGLARLSNVTDARQKLLDYGRPALEYVRQQSTPAMADTFHVFLLSLYSNVGLAATVPRPR
jgi:hypothetical protein